jgi:hypothetical protein
VRAGGRDTGADSGDARAGSPNSPDVRRALGGNLSSLDLRGDYEIDKQLNSLF